MFIQKKFLIMWAIVAWFILILINRRNVGIRLSFILEWHRYENCPSNIHKLSFQQCNLMDGPFNKENYQSTFGHQHIFPGVPTTANVRRWACGQRSPIHHTRPYLWPLSSNGHTSLEQSEHRVWVDLRLV